MIWIAGIFVCVMALICLSCCAAASRADDMMDEIYRDLANKE